MPLLDRPFPRLVAHFANVIIRSGQDAKGSDLEFGAGALLAILALPGAFFSLTLFDKYSSLLRWLRRGREIDPLITSIPDKYFFIVFSMVVTGIVAVLKWDRIFPGRQDYANLAPLPFASRNIYFANLAAIILFACLFAVDVNAASALLFPMVVLAGGGVATNYFAFMGAHALTVFMASAFTFFACFAIVGTLLACLPGRLFRSVSLFARLILIVSLVALLFTSFAVPAKISHWRWLPPVWFLAFYQDLQGKPIRALTGLSPLAWKALGGSMILAMVSGVAGYRRHFLRLPESSGSNLLARRGRRIGFVWFDRLVLRNPVERACYHFALRGLLRSEFHCILFGAFAAMGLIAATQLVVSAPQSQVSLLAVPLALIYFVTTGLRFVFEVPAGLTANWVFKSTLDVSVRAGPMVARKLLFTFLAPVLILCLGGSWYLWGPGLAIEHTLITLAFSVLLIELLLLRYRKIPFACAQPGLENSAILMILAYAIGFFVFTSAGSHFEQWMMVNPIRLLALIPVAAGAWYGLREVSYEALDPDAHLIYEIPVRREVQRLDIVGTSSS